MTKTFEQQRGAGLIEVMVTVLLLGTTLLALAALQSRSLQYNHGAYLRSQANILAYDIIDRMRINRPNISDYVLAVDDDPPTAGLAGQDLTQWRGNIAAALPEGLGGISCNAANVCTITIQWTEQDIADEEDSDTTQFNYTTRL